MHSDEITARQAMDILGYRDRSSISRLVSSNDLHPTRRLDGPGESGAAFFLRAEVEAFKVRRDAKRAERRPQLEHLANELHTDGAA